MEEDQTTIDSNINSSNLPSNPPVSSSTPPPINPPAGKSKLPRVIILGIILLILLAGSVVGFYVFKQQGTKQIRCTEETKICPDGISVSRTGPKCEFAPCPNVKITPDPTADWQIYAGEGFTFKYPSTLKPTTIGTDKTIHVNYSEVIPTNKPDGMEQGPGFSLSFLIKDMQSNLKDAYNADFKNNALLKEIVLKDIKQGEYSGFTFTTYSTYIYLSNNNGKYIVINYSVNDKNNKGYQKIIDQILSTFKFTDNQTIDTSTWKTYKNTLLSLEYPPDYKIEINPQYINIYDKAKNLGPNNLYLSIDYSLKGVLSDYDNTVKEWSVRENAEKINLSNGFKLIYSDENGQVYQVDTFLKYNKGAIRAFYRSTPEIPSKTYDQIISTIKLKEFISPTPTCMPRPACLTATPRCMIPEPANGWCP